MNAVSLIGTLTAAPDLQEPRSGVPRCRMRLAVPRRARTGSAEPGVVYIDVTTFGEEARECARRLKLGSRVGLAGRLDSDDPRESAGVLIDQLDYL
jgi:single-stranded DNA-binding protein